MQRREQRRKKSASKSAASRRGVPFKPGPDPRRGKGPSPGTGGRPKSEVRAACRAAFDERIGILTRIADGKLADTSPGDRIRALDALAKYGGLTYSEMDARLDGQVSTPDLAPPVLALPSNGREAGAREAALESLRQRGLLPATRRAPLSSPNTNGRGA